MSHLSWTLPAFPAPNQGISQQGAVRQIDKLYGRDIWWNYAAQGVVQRQVADDGDWRSVGGIEALRQAIIRRIITNPGEWTTLPSFGVGARNYVKARNVRSTRDELTNRIKEQLLQDPRIERVEQVIVEARESVLRIQIQVTPKARLSPNGVGVVLEIQ